MSAASGRSQASSPRSLQGEGTPVSAASALISDRQLDDVLAWRAQRPVRVREFLEDAHALANRLPAGGWLLNLCEDRYHFAVGFAAGLLAGKVSLQPSSQSPETLQRLAADYTGSCWLSEQPDAVPGLPGCRFPDLAALPRAAVHEMPQIDDQRLVAILFTSGSTGLPQPHRKTWGKLVRNGRAEAEALGLLKQPQTIVGTVPVQHSYGFESTLLMALHGGCQFSERQAVLPAGHRGRAGGRAAPAHAGHHTLSPLHVARLQSAGAAAGPGALGHGAAQPRARAPCRRALRCAGARDLRFHRVVCTGQPPHAGRRGLATDAGGAAGAGGRHHPRQRRPRGRPRAPGRHHRNLRRRPLSAARPPRRPDQHRRQAHLAGLPQPPARCPAGCDRCGLLPARLRPKATRP